MADNKSKKKKKKKSKVVKVNFTSSQLEYGTMSEPELPPPPPVVSLQERCRKNYLNSYKMYQDFFLQCVEEIEALQPSAFACIQVSRYFVIGVLPNACYIPDPLTPKERERVERLLRD